MDLNRPELALNGGPPVRTAGWKDNLTIGEAEKQAALRVLDSGYLSLFEGSHMPDKPFSFYGGPEVQSLEAEWCEYYQVEHAISLNSATSGLYAAIGALGIGYGDEVIVSPYTMTACAIAPLIYGAIPVFADVELATGCLDPQSIEERITSRTKAIIVVHQFGIPADMCAITDIAGRNRLTVIEDCAQAHGAQLNDQYVGTFGDIGIFSLNVNKSIQTGEGGICITADPDLAYRLALIRNHGEAVVGPANYDNIVNIAGFNYRLTELQAAIAREQLKKLDQLNFKRLQLVERLSKGISSIPFLIPPVGRNGAHSTYYVYPLRYDKSESTVSRADFVRAVNAEGALFYEGYTPPLYLQPIYQKKSLFKNGYPFSASENAETGTRYEKGRCPHTEELHFEAMIINEHVRYPHDDEDIDDLVRCLIKVAGG